MSDELLNILSSAASALAFFLSLHNKKASDSFKRESNERHQALSQSLETIAKAAAESIAAATKPAEEPKAKRQARKVKDLTLAKVETPVQPEPAKAPAKPRRKPAKGAM